MYQTACSSHESILLCLRVLRGSKSPLNNENSGSIITKQHEDKREKKYRHTHVFKQTLNDLRGGLWMEINGLLRYVEPKAVFNIRKVALFQHANFGCTPCFRFKSAIKWAHFYLFFSWWYSLRNTDSQLQQYVIYGNCLHRIMVFTTGT